MVVYPEGGTTNGKFLVKFKKGAFVGLRSIKPILIKYESPTADFEGCIIPLYSNMTLCASNLFCSIKVTELPVFKPNEYFFKHHQQEGEERWETYARVIRLLMSKHGNLTLSDQTAEDKFEYKSLIYKGKKGKMSD